MKTVSVEIADKFAPGIPAMTDVVCSLMADVQTTHAVYLLRNILPGQQNYIPSWDLSAIIRCHAKFVFVTIPDMFRQTTIPLVPRRDTTMLPGLDVFF